MTRKKAIKDSLIKWEYAKRTGCTFDELYDWLYNNRIIIWKHYVMCGLCEKYLIKSCYICNICNNCPLYKKWNMDCSNSNSLYQKWKNAKTPKTRKKYATMIYNDISELL